VKAVPFGRFGLTLMMVPPRASDAFCGVSTAVAAIGVATAASPVGAKPIEQEHYSVQDSDTFTDTEIDFLREQGVVNEATLTWLAGCRRKP